MDSALIKYVNWLTALVFTDCVRLLVQNKYYVPAHLY